MYKPNGIYDLFPIRRKGRFRLTNFPECHIFSALTIVVKLRKFRLEVLRTPLHATVRKMDVSMRESLLEAARLMYPHLLVPAEASSYFSMSGRRPLKDSRHVSITRPSFGSTDRRFKMHRWWRQTCVNKSAIKPDAHVKMCS